MKKLTFPNFSISRFLERNVRLYVFALSILFPHALFSAKIQGGGLEFEVDEKTGALTKVQGLYNSAESLSSGNGGINIYDGNQEQKLKFLAPIIQKSNGESLKYSCSEQNGSLVKAVKYSGNGKSINISVELKNPSDKQRLLEIQIGLPLNFSSKEWKYWDGGDFYDYGKGKARHWQGEDFTVKIGTDSNILALNADPVIRHLPHAFRTDDPNHAPGPEAWHMFPCTCVYNEKMGLALGIDPNQILSYHSGGVQPKVSSERAFFYGTKIVLDPKQSLKVKFVVFAFKPEFAWRNCLEIFYSLYPELYSLRKDVDQRITGPCGGHWAASVGWLVGEQQRRLRRQWTWYYAPFLMTGVTFPLPENWNPTRLNAVSSRMRNYRKNIPYERFVHDIADSITEMHRYLAVAFYVYNWRADYYAAKHYYPDAIISKEEVERNKKDRNNAAYSNVLEKGVELLVSVSPHNPDFFKFTVDNYKKIAKIYKPDGIAFDDCTGASPYYFDEHTYKVPGRTFSKFFSYGHVFGDKKNHIMTKRGVAARLLGNEVHKLKNRDGKTLFIAANSPNDYLSCTTTDVAVQERVRSAPVIPEDENNKNKLWGLGLRRMMGSKPISLLMGNRSSEKFTKRDLDLYCLYIGATRCTAWNAEGIKMAKYQSLLSKAGWQATPGIKTKADILVSRFGKGLGTYIVAINRNAQKKTALLEVLNKYIGEKRYIFCGYEGEKVKNIFSRASNKVHVEIPSKGFLILKIAGFLGDVKTDFSVLVSEKNNEIVLELEETKEPLSFAIKLPDGAAPAEQENLFSPKENTVAVKCAKKLTKVAYVPEIVFLTPPEKISNFPFYKDKTPNASVIYSNNKLIPEKKVIDATIAISSFFGYHNAFKKLKNNSHQILYQANLYPVIQTKMLEWLEPEESAIVVSSNTGIRIPPKVSELLAKGHGVIYASTTNKKRPVLFILAENDRTFAKTMQSLLKALEPYFPSFKWELKKKEKNAKK